MKYPIKEVNSDGSTTEVAKVKYTDNIPVVDVIANWLRNNGNTIVFVDGITVCIKETESQAQYEFGPFAETIDVISAQAYRDLFGSL